MINLLFFGSDYNVGLTTALTEQILNIAKIEDINLVCISSQNEMQPGLHEQLKRNRISVHIINNLDLHKNFLGITKEIERIISTNNITHVNVHNNWQMALVTFVKYKNIWPKGFKIVYTIHGYRHNSAIKAKFAIGIIGLALFLFANRVISMSGYVSKRFWFVKHKMDLVFYIMNKPEYRLIEHEIDTTNLEMVFPAQFRAGKNQDILIKAAHKYKRETGDQSFKLILPGEGPLRDTYRRMVRDMGLDNNVFFPGKLRHEEVLELYKGTNIALVSSNVETYGRCIAEPFILGRCVITRRTGVATDIIRDGINGFFFRNEEELSAILVKLHQNPRLIAKIAKAAYQDRILFSPDKVMESYVSALRNA